MIFSTNLFVFLFLPTFLSIYYLTPWRYKSYVILAASYAFYGWWRIEYLLLVFGMSLFSYYAANLAKNGSTTTLRKAALWVGIVGDLGVLGYFKYANFFVDNYNGILTFTGGQEVAIATILLPIGISFHTFQSVSYVVDVYRGDAPPARRLVDFLAFGSLFPQLIAGPVLRYKDLASQFVEREHSLEQFTQGVYRFIQGLAMKVLIADSISPLADRIFLLPTPTVVESWLGAFSYTFQLFFDFAGYSAMAIGLGLMIGFRFIENFNAPYTAVSITDFWQRWHISLSTWLRDYLYIPLGGNRCGKRRTYINLLATMILGGFWHGSNWTFIIWGIWHGGLMAVERAFGARGKPTVYPKGLGMPLTFLLVILGWVIFRSATVSDALNMYRGMIGVNGFWITPEIQWQIKAFEITALILAAVMSFASRYVTIRSGRLSPALQAFSYTVLAFASLSQMAAQNYSPFLYFQF